jgi:hypothetical protein
MASIFACRGGKTEPLRSVISMGQQLIAMYLSLKGLNAVAIYNDLVATPKGEAKPYSTVTYYLRKPSFSSPKTPQPSESPAPILNESDESILLALSKQPFASVRQFALRERPHPASDATRRELRGKQGAPSNGLSKESCDSKDGRTGRKVANGREKRQKREDKPEIGLFYTLRHSIYINGKSV